MTRERRIRRLIEIRHALLGPYWLGKQTADEARRQLAVETEIDRLEMAQHRHYFANDDAAHALLGDAVEKMKDGEYAQSVALMQEAVRRRRAGDRPYATAAASQDRGERWT